MTGSFALIAATNCACRNRMSAGSRRKRVLAGACVITVADSSKPKGSAAAHSIGRIPKLTCSRRYQLSLSRDRARILAQRTAAPACRAATSYTNAEPPNGRRNLCRRWRRAVSRPIVEVATCYQAWLGNPKRPEGGAQRQLSIWSMERWGRYGRSGEQRKPIAQTGSARTPRGAASCLTDKMNERPSNNGGRAPEAVASGSPESKCPIGSARPNQPARRAEAFLR